MSLRSKFFSILTVKLPSNLYSLKVQNTDENKLLERAESLIEIDRYKDAVPLITKLLAQDSNNYRGSCLLAICFLYTGRFGNALEQLKKGN